MKVIVLLRNCPEIVVLRDIHTVLSLHKERRLENLGTCLEEGKRKGNEEMGEKRQFFKYIHRCIQSF